MRAHIEDTKNEIVLKKNTTTCTNFIRKLILKNNEFVALLEEETMQQLGHFANYYRCSVEKAFSTAQLPVPLESVLAVYVDNKLRGDAIS